MYLHSLATAVPPAAYSQLDCWKIIEQSEVRTRLKKRSQLILNTILKSDHGISERHFAVPNIQEVFNLSIDELNAAFRAEAPKLAGTALTSALGRAGLKPADLDALLICTCTGYLCPGISSYVAEQLGLRDNAILHDLVGLGCGAAIPTLRAASHVLAANPQAKVAVVAVEICSAAFYLDDDPGVLISACLFSDGAAAAILRAEKPGVSPFDKLRAGDPGYSSPALRFSDFQSLHLPQLRDKLRFETRNGKLRNLLDRSVPELAASAVKELWSRRGERPVSGVVAHPGGRDVLEAVGAVVPHPLDASARVLAANGNMSSPSVLFALEEALKAPAFAEPSAGSAADLWLVSFGAGFSAHSCRLGI